GVWAPLATSMKKVLTSANMTVPYTGFYTPNSKLNYETVLLPVTKHCRILMFLAFSEEVAKLLWTASNLGMRNGEYAFLTLDFNIEMRYVENTWPYVPKEELFATFEGIVDIAVGKPEGPKYEQTITELTAIMKSKDLYIVNQTLTFGTFIIDAISLYAYGVNRTIEKGGDYKDGRAIIATVSVNKLLFTGSSGYVGIDANGNRVPLFVFSNRQSDRLVPTFIVDLLKKPGEPGYFIVLNDTKQIWPGGGTTVPVDEPRCGFDGSKCPEIVNELSDWYYMLVLLPILLLVLGIVGFLHYRRKLFERDLLSATWLIPYHRLTLLSEENRFSSKVRSRVSLASSLGFSGNLLTSNNVGRYKGELVVIKKLRKENVNLTREMLIDMKKSFSYEWETYGTAGVTVTVRDLRHANLNQYLGVCVESPNICIISLFCNRGSLQDILGNDDITLEWMFRQSFANDIVSGMEALHRSAVHVHGNLKSSNCLIDSRWVCKLGDYGLELLRENQSEKETGEHAKYRDMLWTAPEHLQYNNNSCSTTSLSTKTQSGDVYSFGIILYELVTRDEPYTNNMETLTPEEIVDQVSSHNIPPYRPQFPKSVMDLHDQRILHCITECWDEDPSKRPSSDAVKKKLKVLNRGKNTNIVDNMIAMMEKYTDQLEVLVEERTKQLAEEKAKTDVLLYKMLPRPIADQLKKGNSVAAESFASVTIFFSDIVGFTSVAAESTPFQVVDLLNALYTCFDKVVDEHDVYKVETIGDAYMIVSGLPVRNENRHAGEIATTALNLLSAVRDFQVPHIPSRKVQLRIGIHTALRIHVSPECREVLNELGGYHLHERGPVTMKGKGTIVTYFLLGKEGFNKSLPDLQDALPLEAHEFK
ncbi:hypothetical protein QZH41_020028, partial [Actinostola sp. cb2023]